MALSDDDVARLDLRAREVGNLIGVELRFFALGNPEYVCLAAGSENVVIVGPSKLSELAALDIDLELDALERGDRCIEPDEDGDPRLRSP